MTVSRGNYNVYPILTPARLASTANISASYYNGPTNSGVGATLTGAAATLTVDGSLVADGDRILVLSQTAPYQNGIYNKSTNEDNFFLLTRTDDFQNIGCMIPGQSITISEGTANGGAIYVLLSPLPEHFGIISVGTENDIVFYASGLNGGFGTAATKNASDNSKATVASVNGATVVNDILVASDTAGTVKDGAAVTAAAGGLQAGASGTAGVVSSFPGTAANGKLILAAVNAGGAFNTTISNGTMGQSTVYSLGDIGASTGGIPVATTAIRVKSVAGAAAAGGAAAQSFSDSFCTSGSCVVGNWNTQANAASVLKIVPGNGSFVVTSSADAGVGTFNYIITK